MYDMSMYDILLLLTCHLQQIKERFHINQWPNNNVWLYKWMYDMSLWFFSCLPVTPGTNKRKKKINLKYRINMTQTKQNIQFTKQILLILNTCISMEWTSDG